MTKTEEIFEYLDDNPGASQKEMVDALGFSRQLVSVALLNRGVRVTSARHRIKGLPCIYCEKEVPSRAYVNGKLIRSRWHKACAHKALRYRGNCPVCGTYFERVGSQVNRANRNDAKVCCSWECRNEANRQGLY